MFAPLEPKICTAFSYVIPYYLHNLLELHNSAYSQNRNIPTLTSPMSISIDLIRMTNEKNIELQIVDAVNWAAMIKLKRSNYEVANRPLTL